MEIIENIYGEDWILNSDSIAFLPQCRTMLIADLHLGKLTHFRNAGIGIPSIGERRNFERLNALLQKYTPQIVIFLGDLFHSKESVVWDDFKQFVRLQSNIQFILVLGNHDVFVKEQFDNITNLKIHEKYHLDKYVLTHEPVAQHLIPTNTINICGHIHPAVSLRGKGKQKLTLRCFLFRTNQLIMPAFGEFTGNFVLETDKSDIIFGIGKNEIFRIN